MGSLDVSQSTKYLYHINKSASDGFNFETDSLQHTGKKV